MKPQEVIKSSVKKSDDDLQIAWGEIYTPDVPGSHGDC